MLLKNPGKPCQNVLHQIFWKFSGIYLSLGNPGKRK
jgi:hypothetical protein